MATKRKSDTDSARKDLERDRLPARMSRYMRIGTHLARPVAREAGTRLLRLTRDDRRAAAELTQALGALKGPLMKVAQLAATVPDLLPPEYAEKLAGLQSNAPPMGAAFVRRRMQAELGPDWRQCFQKFDLEPSAAASLGQVHRAVSTRGTALALKLQYPDMSSAVEADLGQLKLLFGMQRRLNQSLDTALVFAEICDRLREELDYEREARHAALYHAMLANDAQIRIPKIYPAHSTRRLLTMQWLEGAPLMSVKGAGAGLRNAIAAVMFRAWWYPFSHFGVMHGDPHPGNYSVAVDCDALHHFNLLDFGCVRIYPARFVASVVELYHGLLHDERARIVHAFENWGFRGLSHEVIDILSIWARFIYGPMLDDRTRSIADGVRPAEFGRKEAFAVQRALRDKGPIAVPREFVFMDRAAIGLGAVYLHLDARLNFHRLFNEQIDHFCEQSVATTQADILATARLTGQ